MIWLIRMNAAFFSSLSGPAQHALEGRGINTPEKLSEFKKSEILKLHGIGAASVPKLTRILLMAGLSFKNEDK
ncbi:MAG TPA: hypothetical protein VHA56_15690 [Mucilaginibacter sp.]|nr:hypothetical protein [Mucilaginibacter sp.]